MADEKPVPGDYPNTVLVVEDFSVKIEAGKKIEYSIYDFTVESGSKGSQPYFFDAVGAPDNFEVSPKKISWIPADNQIGSYEIEIIIKQNGLRATIVKLTVVVGVNLDKVNMIKGRIESGDSSIVRWFDNNWVRGIRNAVQEGLTGAGLKVVEVDSSISDANNPHIINKKLKYRKSLRYDMSENNESAYTLDDADGTLYHSERVRGILAGRKKLSIFSVDNPSLNKVIGSVTDTGVSALLPGIASDAELIGKSSSYNKSLYTDILGRSLDTRHNVTDLAIAGTLSLLLHGAREVGDADVVCSSLGDGYPLITGTAWATPEGADEALTDDYYSALREYIGDADPVFVLTPGNNGDYTSDYWSVSYQGGINLYQPSHGFVLTRRGTPDRDWFADRTIIAGCFIDARHQFTTYGTKPGPILSDNFVMAQGLGAIGENSSIGTSFAQPAISGMVLLLKEKYPKASSPMLVKAILEGAHSNSGSYDPSEHGKGILDFNGAVAWMEANK